MPRNSSGSSRLETKTLVGLRSFKIQCVVDRQGHLAAHALHELQLRIGDALRDKTAKSHCAQTALRGGKRNHSQGANAHFAEPVKEIWKSLIVFRVADDKGLLRLPDPARRMALHRSFAAGFYRSRKPGFENVETHDIAHGVMKDQGEEVKVDNAMETLCQVVK